MFDPLRSKLPLIVYLDVKSPYAFIARKPTYRLAESLGIEIDWRPLTLNIPSYLGSARLDKTGRVAESQRTPQQWSAVKYAYRDARRYAGLQGYVLRGTEKIWDTSLIHIAMVWVADQGQLLLKRFLDDVLESFWRREFDAEDIVKVIDAMDRAGADVDGFEAHAAGEGRRMHDDAQEKIFAAGIFGVPTYVVEEEIYFGREHLPRVRWILEGRKGPAPDIAYELEATGRMAG